MKIDKNKPLPDHTKIDYDECCAKLILLELFSETYRYLEIQDKPDLQGENVGIEVTIANDQTHQEALNNWVKANTCDDEDKKERYIERMKQLGVTYTGGFQAWPGVTPSLKYVKESVEKKIKKIQNGGYKAFSRYELFVFTDTWFHEEILKEACDYFRDHEVYKTFSRIYILETGFKLHIFETIGHRLIVIDKTEQTNRNIRARELVEAAEEE